MDATYKIFGQEDNCIFKSDTDLTTSFSYLESFAVGTIKGLFKDARKTALVVKTSTDDRKALDNYSGHMTLILGSGNYEMLIAIINACYKIGVDLSFINPTGQLKYSAWSKFF